MKIPVSFREGMRDGIPIGLGYFAAAFSLGIAARNAGLNAFQGFLASIVTVASAGEYAGFTVIAARAAYLEMLLVTLVASGRYLLMSSALSQRLDPKLPLWHRLLLAHSITDEIFGISIARDGYLDPRYSYGALCVAAPLWAVGTAFGILVGNIMPARVVSALSVALFGMFLAIIIPPAKKSRVIAVLVVLCFGCSWLASVLPGISSLSAGTRTIILTVLLAGGAAILFPVKEDDHAA